MSEEDAERLQAAARDDGDLLVWTIYEHPGDYPKLYVARPFSSRRGAPFAQCMTALTLDAIRAMLPVGLTPMARAESDDPVIVESWF